MKFGKFLSGGEQRSEKEEDSLSEKRTSRRKFLSTLGAAAVGGTAAYGIYAENANVHQSEEAKKRVRGLMKEGKNIARMETTHASYVISYNEHFRPSSRKIVSETDALLLESSGVLTSEAAARAEFSNIADGMMPDYIQVIRRAAQEKKPVFLIDAIYENETEMDSSFGGYSEKNKEVHFLKTIEMLAGSAFTAAALAPSSKKMSRREFLSRGALAMGGVYLLSHVPESILESKTFSSGDALDEASFKRKSQKGLGDLNAVIHPEIRTEQVHGRDALMAQKAETVARALAKDLGRKPKLALEVGAAHYGIEKELQRSDEDRITTLKCDMSLPLRQQARIVRFDVAEKLSVEGGKEYDVKVSFLYDEMLANT